MTCFNCGREGHVSAHCPDERVRSVVLRSCIAPPGPARSRPALHAGVRCRNRSRATCAVRRHTRASTAHRASAMCATGRATKSRCPDASFCSTRRCGAETDPAWCALGCSGLPRAVQTPLRDVPSLPTTWPSRACTPVPRLLTLPLSRGISPSAYPAHSHHPARLHSIPLSTFHTDVPADLAAVPRALGRATRPRPRSMLPLRRQGPLWRRTLCLRSLRPI